MAKYLLQASYTEEGLKGLLKDGGSKRRAAAEEALAGEWKPSISRLEKQTLT